MDLQLASGFDRSLGAEMILDACKVGQVTYLLIKFIGAGQPEWVVGSVAFAKVPQMVMVFFEDIVMLTLAEDGS